VILLATLASACATPWPAAKSEGQARDIVGSTLAAARAAPPDQARQLASAQKAFAASPDDANRVRLAALLATLPPPFRDDARAATLLEPLSGRAPDSAMTQLAGLLAASLAERQRLARDLRAAEVRVDAAEQRITAAEQRALAAERREETATERANTLHRQVEALKSIERGILEREERRRTLQR
jgi:hypothetical protein